jgi:hypothetical protein
MPAPSSKLVLPTVETCRWRRPAAGDSAAECGLVADLLGEAPGGLAAVSDEACAACCRSFPPTRRTLNPVVAGLLYQAASRALAAEVAGGRVPAAAERARARAEASLAVALPEPYRLTPARYTVACAWRGGPAAAGGGPTPDPEGHVDGPLHICEHPGHDLASPARCRACRDWSRRRPISRRLSLEEIVPPPARRCGRPVRGWAVGVTTAPRRLPTLEACLDGVVRAGWGAPRLFLDGTTRVPPRYAHLPTSWREEGVGAWPAWYLALVELLVQRPDADAYLMLQDDVALHDRGPLRDYLERALWPGDRPGLVLLFYTGPGAERGWHDRSHPVHCSAQALLFPPSLARALVADPPVVRSVLASSADHHTPIPDVLNAWVWRNAVDCWHTAPSLAQHIGNLSAIWEDLALTGRRRAPWFSGSLEDPFALEEDPAAFPEDDFACDPADRDTYRRQVERGRDRMRAATAVVGAVCRDVRPLLPRLAARLERLGGMFRDYRVVLVDDASVDATREFLVDWRASDPRVEVLDGPPGPPRPGRAARCRERLRERLVAGHGGLDLAIFLDPDPPGGWSYDGLAHTLGADGWDAVGSLGLVRGPVREGGAEPWVPHDPAAFRPAALRPGAGAAAAPWRRGGPMVPVASCFGGLGVYRMDSLRAGRFDGDDGGEFVAFHDRLRHAGHARLFLNPSQIVLYSPA